MSASAARRRRVTLQRAGWARGGVRLLDIRAGDLVEVIAGRDKGKRGVVERTVPARQRLVVAGVNVLKRHTKAGVKDVAQGGIVDFNAPIAYSNVMLVCNRCDRRTRIGRVRAEDGSSVMVCKRCGEHHERTSI